MPIVVGVVVAAITIVVVKLILGRSKKQTPPKTLVEPTVKYPLKLVDKEVYYCTMPFVYQYY